MKLQTIFVIGCLSVVVGCSRPADTEALYVDIDPTRVTADSAIFKNREIIILETKPEAIMSDIVAMDMYKDNLYILDKRRENILVFRKDGMFVSTIGRRGRGPGEYPSITAFCVDRPNDELIILAGWPRKLMFYSLLGEFLGETEIADPLYQIIKSGDKLYGRITTDEKHDFVVYTIEDHRVRSVEYPKIPGLKTNKEEVVTPAGNMILGSKYGSLFTRVFDNTIYKADEEGLIPLATLDFGKYQLPDANTLSGDELREKISQDRIIYGISNARMMGKDKIVFDAFPHGVFVIDGGEARQYGKIKDGVSGLRHNNMTTWLGSETEYVAFTMEASFFRVIPRKDSTSLNADRARLARVKPNDNPVIYLYKL